MKHWVYDNFNEMLSMELTYIVFIICLLVDFTNVIPILVTKIVGWTNQCHGPIGVMDQSALLSN